jgi:hypothetical protein
MKTGMLIYQIFILAVLFTGGYLLLRFGMNVDASTSLYIALIGMPIATFLIWFTKYRGKEFH